MGFIIRDAQVSDADFIARTVLSGVGYAAFEPEASDQQIELGSGIFSMASAVDVFTDICARADTLYSYTRTRIAVVDGRPAGALVSYPGSDNAALRNFTWGLLDGDFPPENSAADNIVDASADFAAASTGSFGASTQPAEVPADFAAASTGSFGTSTQPAEVSADFAAASTGSFGTSTQPAEVSADFAESFANVDAECEAGEYYLDSLAVHPDFRGRLFDYEGVQEKLGHILLQDGIRRGQTLGYTRTSLIVDVDRPRLHHYYSQLGFRPVRDILFFGHRYTRMVR